MIEPICLNPWDSQGHMVWDAVHDSHFTCLRGCGGGGYQASYVLLKAGIKDESISSNHRIIMCEQPSGKLYRTGCIQQHVACDREE